MQNVANEQPRSAGWGSRLLELDSLRGIAALLVVLYHYTSRYPELFGQPGALPVEFSYGIYGVDLFFVISGYVIFMTLERTRHPLDFVISRATRLYPAYWACIFLTAAVVLTLHLPGREPSLAAIALNLTMLQFLSDAPNVDGVYWTLALELSFYTIMLLIFVFRLNRHITAVAAIWLAMIIIANLLEQQAAVEIPRPLEIVTLLEYGQLFWIGIVVYLYTHNGFTWHYLAIILAGLAIEYVFAGYLEGTFVLAAVLVLTLAIKGKLRFMRAPIWVYFGVISYPLYLLHQNIGYAVIRELQSQGWSATLSVVLALALVVALASAVTFLIERPAMASLRRLYRNRLLGWDAMQPRNAP